MAHYFTNKYSPYTSIPRDDLFQAACEGLCVAAQSYDPEKSTAFSSYAFPWVKKYVLREMNQNLGAAHIPLNLAEAATTIRLKRSSLLSSLGREPTEEELAEACGLRLEQVRNALAATQSSASLDEPVGSAEDALSLGETLPGSNSPEEALLLQDTSATIRNLVATLPEKEAAVINLRFGLCGQPPLTLEETGKRIGIGRERVRQLQSNGIRSLRHPARRKMLI